MSLSQESEYSWRPQFGPQEAFVKAEFYFDALLGGARGGGKTDACLGEFALHAKKYGPNARGVFMRREMPQADSLIDRSHQIYGPLGWTYHKMERQWTGQNGSILRFRPLEDDRDAEKYQGQFFCVAVGTKIRMADGSHKRIEAIEDGEMVATLLGPRRVVASIAPYVAECVRALVRDASGAVVGEQVHPVWHPVLTTFGLTLSRTEGCSRIHGRCEPGVFASNTPSLGSRRGDDQGVRGWFAFLEDGPSGYASSEWIRRECLRLGRLTVPVVLHAPSSRSRSWFSHGFRGLTKVYRSLCRSLVSCCAPLQAGQPMLQHLRMGLARACEPVQRATGFSGPCWTSVAGYAVGGSQAVQGFLGGYRGAHGSCDEPSRQGEGSARVRTPLPSDAAQQSRAVTSDELGTIPSNIHPGQASWVHPYSGEELDLAQDVSFGTMELEYVGSALVTDLCVEEANHYITDSGLINKNTRVYLEELTNWPSPRAPDKMKATLRSAHGVPTGFRATANPGGAGHHWVKQRYIDPSPAGMVPIMDEAGKLDRIFIPARVTDNTALITNDPDYVERLKLSGSKELVRAWLEGDWAVVEGAFFDNFSSARHIVRPFEVPKHWVRFRAMDWGSAAPFSVGWYAVVSDDYRLLDGRCVPRGGLVKYREWYGASGPNVGLKLTAEAVAAGIHEREALDGKIDYGVLDPAAFAQDGGPSIAERLRYKPHEIAFRPADNKRIGTLGHIAGWDLVRHRLDGEAPDRPMLVFFETCRDTIRTLPLVQHDPARVEDLDTKSEDHCFAGDTLVMTSEGNKALKDLVGTEGFVRTEGGRLTRYHSCRMTRRGAEVVRVRFDNGLEVTCTPDHKFLTLAGWVEAQYLSGAILSPFQKLAKSLWEGGITAAGSTSSAKASGSTEPYGMQHAAASSMGGTSTMSMVTAATTLYPTWNSLKARSTSVFTDYSAQTKAGSALNEFAPRLLSGTGARPVESGTSSSSPSTFARYLGAWSTWFASIVASLFRPSGSRGKERSSVTPTARLVRCVGVELLSERTDVYCLTVPETSCFAIETGLIVHNCVDELRYACASRPWIRNTPKGDLPVKGLESVTLQHLWNRQAKQKENRL